MSSRFRLACVGLPVGVVMSDDLMSAVCRMHCHPVYHPWRVSACFLHHRCAALDVILQPVVRECFRGVVSDYTGALQHFDDRRLGAAQICGSVDLRACPHMVQRQHIEQFGRDRSLGGRRPTVSERPHLEHSGFRRPVYMRTINTFRPLVAKRNYPPL